MLQPTTSTVELNMILWNTKKYTTILKDRWKVTDTLKNDTELGRGGKFQYNTAKSFAQKYEI